MRFNLRFLFLAIALLALACAGLMYHTSAWASSIWMVTWTFIVFAVVKAVSTSGRSRVRCISFAFAGVAYLAVCKTTSFAEEGFPTNQLIASIAKITVRKTDNLDSTQIAAYGLNPAYGNLLFARFFNIGHCLFSWIFALLAAWFAGRMYDRRERATKEAT
jgi:hypothetical protein